MNHLSRLVLRLVCLTIVRLVPPALGAVNVYLLDVPDYAWHAGCFGTASGNLFGYWDRNGFPDYYTGPTGGGLAPLNDNGANKGIRSMWASQAGLDGRPASLPGHFDDYYVEYESTKPDPYLTAGRLEHTPDCIGDFIGLSQNKWRDLNGECDGNIDAFSFTYWDPTGRRRSNFQPPQDAVGPATDIPSGLRRFSEYRGYSCDTFSQLTDFNPTVAAGQGFSFDDLRAEIDAGYPVLLFLQYYDRVSRAMPGMPRANPNMHGMLAYGYLITDDGRRYVRYRTSWASGDNQLSQWTAVWNVAEDLPVKGVIGLRPHPRISGIERSDNHVRLSWHAPKARLYDAVARTETPVHSYVIERSRTLDPASFRPVGDPIQKLEVALPDCCDGTLFFRVKLLPGPPP